MIVIKGRKHPRITSEDGTTNLKPKAEWTNVEDDKALRNSKAMNDIFNVIDKNMFIFINTCSEAKETWDILKIMHEGTSKF